MSELSTDDFLMLSDIATEFDSCINLLDAWAENNCISEVCLIMERLKPKAKNFMEFIQKY